MYDPIFNASETADEKLQIELSTEIDGLDIYYSFDNSFPDNFYPKYTQAGYCAKRCSATKSDYIQRESQLAE